MAQTNEKQQIGKLQLTDVIPQKHFDRCVVNVLQYMANAYNEAIEQDEDEQLAISAAVFSATEDPDWDDDTLEELIVHCPMFKEINLSKFQGLCAAYNIELLKSEE